MRSVQAIITDIVLSKGKGFDNSTYRDYEAEWKKNARMTGFKLSKGMSLEEIDLNGQKAELIKKEGNDKGLIFYIHGGGFTTGSARERRIFTYPAVRKYGYDCMSINYRLAPENKWPAQIEDCLEAYENTLKIGYDPKDIILMGESAGGTLVLSLGLFLKDRGLPMPKVIVAFSPATDQYEDLPSHKANIKTDRMLRDGVAKGICDVLFDHKPSEAELKQYLLSPYYGDYEGLPPIHLSASDSEVLYDDARILYEKLKKEGHEVMYEEGYRVCHAYQIMTYMPESRKTLKNMFRYIEEIKGEDNGKIRKGSSFQETLQSKQKRAAVKK